MSKEQAGDLRKGRMLVGRVVSDKMAKTISVLVERRVRHVVYGKTVTLSKKYHARDEMSLAREGDVVEIVECRPISKTVCWRVNKLVEKAKVI